MEKNKLDTIIRNFLFNEGSKPEPSVRSRFLALEELLNKISGKSLTEVRRLEIVKEQLSSLKREVNKIEQKNLVLEEEVRELQEKLILIEGEKE